MQVVPAACPEQLGPAVAVCFSKFSLAAEPLTRFDGQSQPATSGGPGLALNEEG